MTARRRKHWGWGYEDEQPTDDELRGACTAIAAHLGFGSTEPESPVALEDVSLPEPRLAAPRELAGICDDAAHARASHAYGKSYRDVVLAFRGRFEAVPDVVARPRDEGDVEKVLAWCDAAGAAVIPYGGGTSVVGGVEPRIDAAYAGAVSLDLGALDRVLEVDEISGAARIQAGASGPALESQLAAHELTLRHYPQSFELSTLGGWIATRAGGHFATLETHIDDLVESVRALTPSGVWSSRRLPGSGAGPSPDRLLIGSEGTLGVITEAWVRVRRRPSHRAGASVRFGSFADGLEGARAVAQSGLYPANCRLIDAAEARTTGAGDGSAAILVLGFESADHPVDAGLKRALQLCAQHGGEGEPGSTRSGAAGAWREAFLRAPYLRDTFVAMGVLSETFETAITWDRAPGFIESALEAARAAVAEQCGAGAVTCRLTHVYTDGAAPYFTILAPARRGEELEQWEVIKRAASDAVIAGGGTITHHHAVGRDHRPWYDLQRPDPFAAALRAAKAAVDPRAILNPGVLVDPLTGEPALPA
ncbi:MAG: FAD-binding oxidoreductase [Solirubrobacteraceae bacterium]|nr:MAG: FAD-binding oxidoreductase [Solirubrobacterales bacterium]